MEEKIFIQNSKLQKLAAIINKPQEEGPFPVVLLLHGFTGYKEEKHLESLAQLLAANNIVAIRFDASGFGESEGTVETDYRVSNYLSDIESVYGHLCKQSFVDSSRIGIDGHSLGGMLAVIFAAKHPELKAVCAVSAVSTHFTEYRAAEKFKGWKETGYREQISSRMGKIKIPYAFIEDANQYNAIEYASKLRSPLLVIVGGKDTAVPASETKEIYDYAPEPKELLEFAEMDHHYKKHPELLQQINQKILQFYITNLS
jgi:uncharacterized protein